MKTRLALILAACAFSLGAQAQTSTALASKSVTVQATVLDTCRFGQSPASTTLHLLLDPSIHSGLSAVQSLMFSCTNGFSMKVGIAGHPGVTDVPRSLTHTAATTPTLPYTLRVATPGGTTGKGFGSGNELSVQLTAEIPAGLYADALSGRYEDTVIIELQP